MAALETAQVPLGTTAVELTRVFDVRDRAYSVAVTPTVDAFVGAAGVTAATGFRVPAGATLTLDLSSGERLFGVLASGTGTAYVLRSGQS